MITSSMMPLHTNCTTYVWLRMVCSWLIPRKFNRRHYIERFMILLCWMTKISRKTVINKGARIFRNYFTQLNSHFSCSYIVISLCWIFRNSRKSDRSPLKLVQEAQYLCSICAIYWVVYNSFIEKIENLTEKIDNKSFLKKTLGKMAIYLNNMVFIEQEKKTIHLRWTTT